MPSSASRLTGWGLASLAVAAAAAPSLTLNATSIKHLDWVRASFTGLNTSSSYWLGVYSPANVSTDAIAPLPYPAAPPWTKSASLKYTGYIPGAKGSSGHYDFELVNPYESVKIVLFEGTIEVPVAVATSPTVTFADSDAPLRGHITRSHDATQMRAVWNTRYTDADAAVQWGTASGVYTGSAAPEYATYTADDLCGDPATGFGWFPPHWWASALMTGLQPSTVYYYRFGSGTHGWSAEHSFVSAPAPGPHQAVNIVVAADMGMTEYDGTMNHWTEPSAGLTTQRMADKVLGGSGYDYSLFLHSGDISYATGMLSKWELYMSRIESSGLGMRVPYQVNRGNHERDFPLSGSFYPSMDSGGECGVPTNVRFPGPGTPRENPEWYAFVHGSVQVLMLGTEMEIGPGSDQFNFINSTLAAVNRSVTPWVVVLGHRPSYYVGNSSEGGGAIDPNINQIEGLLMQHRVDVVAWGHVHNAFVSCPVYAGACVKAPSPGAYDAPRQVCVGNAGQTLTPINDKVQPAWVEWQMAEYGYATISVHNATTMTWSWFMDSDDSLQHSFTIERNWPREY